MLGGADANRSSHPKGMTLRPKECAKLTCSWPIIAVCCGKSLTLEGKLLQCIALVRKTTFEDLGLANLNYRICVLDSIRAGGKKPVLDTLYNDATEVGSSGRVLKVLPELSDELVRHVARDR
jgi:hypothetical protein